MSGVRYATPDGARCSPTWGTRLDAERDSPRIVRSRGHGAMGSDIVAAISEVVAMEQILIRNLPAGTKAALRARAEQHHRSAEAEARELLADALRREPVTIVDLLSVDDGADIEFEPERLGLSARSAEL